MSPAKILAREIKKHFEGKALVHVHYFKAAEAWVALVQGVHDHAISYTCEVGSDDDGFLFTTVDEDEEFYIPLPADWPV